MKSKCEREDCFAWTSPKRYGNCCVALENIYECDCPFYKSREQASTERELMRARAAIDPYYRQLLLEYGIKFKHRGRKPGGRD